MLMLCVTTPGDPITARAKMDFVEMEIHAKVPRLLIHITRISNSNWTEWSTIQGVIERVISKSDEREARLLPELYDTRSNY